MKYLLLQQRSANGIEKTWTIKSHDRDFSFGSSKFADIQSFATGIHGIQGVFKWEKQSWNYINLQLSSENLNDEVKICLDKELEIKIGSTILKIFPFEAPKTLFSSDLLASDQTQGKAFQLFKVYSGKRLLETKIINFNESFTSDYDLKKTKLTPQNTKEWIVTDIDHLTVKQKTVYLTDASGLASIKAHHFINSENRGSLYLTLGLSGLMALLFLISPSSKNAGEVAKNSQVPREYREIKLSPPKKKKISASANVVQNSAPAAAVPASNSNAMDKIKSLAGTSRLSQLLGKISATGAKSSRLIVSNGTSAGSAPSGRALAALGKVDQAGKDWGAEGKATSTGGVSTNGIAGGRGVAGMGTLATGKTGTGGAQLLDDESEIIGGLDRDIIAQYIHSQLGQILYCYERQLSANPDLFGKVAVRFTIGPKGDIETQRIQDTTLRNSNVEGCILSKVAKWKFPEPQGGTKVNVTYPFLFKSTN